MVFECLWYKWSSWLLDLLPWPSVSVQRWLVRCVLWQSVAREPQAPRPVLEREAAPKRQNTIEIYKNCVLSAGCFFLFPCIALHCVALRYVTLHCITYIIYCTHTLHYITVHYVTLRYVTVHYVMLRYVTLHDVTTIHTCIPTNLPPYIHTYIH